MKTPSKSPQNDFSCQHRQTIMPPCKHASESTLEALKAMPESKEVVICIPAYPPSVNHVWKRGKGGTRVFLDEKVRFFRDTVRKVVMTARRQGDMPKEPLAGKLAMFVELLPPDRRRRDVDNPLKGLLDALTHCGVWGDDCQVKELTVRMLPYDRREKNQCFVVLRQAELFKIGDCND